MIFYNGFNLLVDLILVFVVYVIAHGIGFRRGLNKNKPPFQACWFDTTQKWGRGGSAVFSIMLYVSIGKNPGIF